MATQALMPTVWLADVVVCGWTDPDPIVEARFEALRHSEGKTTGLAECCGVAFPVRYAYRCLECGRWAHAKCLARHFKATGNAMIMVIGGLAHETDMGPWTGGVTPA